MKRVACLFAMPVLLWADWKIVTRTGDSALTEYFKGSLMRTDSSPAYTTVIDFEHRRQVNWRNDLRQYELVEWPPAVQPYSLPGTVINIERHTSDTGERKPFFGRTARHLVSHVTRSDGPETVIDGWYIDAQGLPKWKGGSGGSITVFTLAVAGQRPAPRRLELKQVGPAPEGLPVWQKTTTIVVLSGSLGHSYESVSDVTELFEGALSDTLFHPPNGYQRVANLPYTVFHPAPRTWAELIKARWQELTDWLSALF